MAKKRSVSTGKSQKASTAKTPAKSKVTSSTANKKTNAKITKSTKSNKKTTANTKKVTTSRKISARKVANPARATKPAKVAKPTKPTKPAKVKADSSLPTAPASAPVPEPKAPSGPKGYTADEYQKYKAQKIRLKNLGNAELKALLKKNLQSMSGNKDELVQKIADGIVLGRIPRCPNCFGGRPKYDYKNGQYYCSGYRDDEDFKNCHTTFTKDQLKRDPWEA